MKYLILLMLIMVGCKDSNSEVENAKIESYSNLQSRIPQYKTGCSREERVFAQTWLYVIESKGFSNNDESVVGRSGLIWLEQHYPISESSNPMKLYETMVPGLVIAIEDWVAKDKERLDSCSPRIMGGKHTESNSIEKEKDDF